MSNKFVSFLMVSCLTLFAACGEKEQEITVQSIALSQPSAELVIGETLNLKATVSPSNATYDGITWTSTKTSVATVSGSGQVSALAEGNTTITAMAGGKTASCSITVVKGYVAVSSISLNKDNLELIEGDSETLTATVSPEDATDKTITWASSKESVATVKDGVVSAIAEGEATITAKAGEKTASCKVVVAKKVIPVESIELNKTELELKKGESSTLTATVLPANASNPSVSWSCSNSDIAKVDQNGKVTAVGGGEAIITAKAGEKTAECKVSVSVLATSVSLNKTSVEMHPSESIQLVATILPEDTTEKASWFSSNPGVASVDETGKVVAHNAGTAIIRVIVSSIEASCSITVSAQTGDVISFADDKVKTKLVAAFDTNGDGELSYDEAAAVTSEDDLKAAFGAIKTYESFDEFQYFTGITRIASSMFENWNLLSSITIPNGVKRFNKNSFFGCANLTTIIIPESVKELGHDVFSGCISLTSISLPDGITVIPGAGFKDCLSLTTISIPESVTSIGYEAFSGCSKLMSINIPHGVTTIGHDAFSNCINLSNVVLPEGLESIQEAAFNGCKSIVSVIIPKSVSFIGNKAFQSCENLSSINIPEGISTICFGTFLGCKSLASITIPDTVTEIGGSAFEGCISLTSIVIPESVSSLGAEAFYGCQGLSSIKIPESVSVIGDSAFYYCVGLTSIIIPRGVRKIDQQAFAYCKNLTSITLYPTTPPAGGILMFFSTYCPIYVPAESVDAYKSAQYWSDYASQIQAIQE